jgi:hypothetical protein
VKRCEVAPADLLPSIRSLIACGNSLSAFEVVPPFALSLFNRLSSRGA